MLLAYIFTLWMVSTCTVILVHTPTHLPRVQFCEDSHDGALQAEASNRQELQARLVEAQREAERDKKAACEQLKGELREAKREIAKLRNQVH